MDFINKIIEAHNEGKTIVFCDMENTELDKEYASKVRQEFRKQTGWKVKRGTPIYNDLTEFSKKYSRKKRDVIEVVVIFRIASGI